MKDSIRPLQNSIRPPEGSVRSLNKVLVIDEMPVISLGLHEAFSLLNKEVIVEYAESIYQALSAAMYEGIGFDLIVAGTPDNENTTGFITLLADLRDRFPGSKIVLFAGNYDPAIVERMQDLGICGYLHKYESVEEIKKVYTKVSGNESYISSIFHTLYFEYRLNPALLQQQEDQLLSVSNTQREILLLLCQGRTKEEIAAALHKTPAEIAEQLNLFAAKL